MDTLKIFSLRLKQLRISNQLSRQDLAKAIGFSKSALVKWESKKNLPNMSALIKLAKLFNVRANYLLGLED